MGLIIDGNRRWAKQQKLSSLEGHRCGYENLKKIIKASVSKGIKYVSVYVFSIENWDRSSHEVDYLMKLMLHMTKKDINEFHKEGIRIKIIGTKKGLPKQIEAAIKNAENKTKFNNRGTLLLCFNYSGQVEIAEAVAGLIRDAIKSGDITPKKIDQYLYAPDTPPLDLVIRTSGEQRISNFMLWRIAYAEFLFVNKYWPAFTTKDLDAALENYATRNRRFGK